MKIGIIGAMESEVVLLVQALGSPEPQVVCGMRFFTGKLGATDVVVVRSGIGKVNAAVCTTVLCDRFGVDVVVNTGVAGALDNRLDIGDVVVATDAVQYDMDARGCGYELGHVPQMDLLAFPMDERLHAAVLGSVHGVVPEAGVWEGRVATGDMFVSTTEGKSRIVRAFDTALCAEMEGAAIAQSASLFGTPCQVIRVISDKAEKPSTEEYDVFEARAARQCAAIVTDFARNLPTVF